MFKEVTALPREKYQTLTEQMFYILLCLEEEQCGVDIMERVAAMTDGRVAIGPGTLYSLLESFLKEGFIRETKVEGRRRSYQITVRGQLLLQVDHMPLSAPDHKAGGQGGAQPDLYLLPGMQPEAVIVLPGQLPRAPGQPLYLPAQPKGAGKDQNPVYGRQQPQVVCQPLGDLEGDGDSPGQGQIVGPRLPDHGKKGGKILRHKTAGPGGDQLPQADGLIASFF